MNNDFDLNWPSFWLGGLLVPVGLGVGWFLLFAIVAYTARPVGKLLRKRYIVWYWIKYLGVSRAKVRNAQLEAANEGQDKPVALVYRHRISLHPIWAVQNAYRETINSWDNWGHKRLYPSVPRALRAAHTVGFRWNRNGIKPKFYD